VAARPARLGPPLSSSARDRQFGAVRARCEVDGGNSPVLGFSALGIVGLAAAGAGRRRARGQATVRQASKKYSFENLYKSSGPSEVPDEEGNSNEVDRNPRRPPSENAASWRQENAKLREDSQFSKSWEWDPNPRGRKQKPFAKGQVVDNTQ
ncbi:unnamed protein product, partial [Polarella glacialis]